MGVMDPAVQRTAHCSCGQLRIVCDGEPVRASVCHCLACQRRTGSVFGAQVRYAADRVQTEGNATAYGRRADSGSMVTFSFCPVCGTTLFWELEGQPGVIAVALGTFAEPGFGEPRFSVYESRRHPWVEISAPVEKN